MEFWTATHSWRYGELEVFLRMQGALGFCHGVLETHLYRFILVLSPVSTPPPPPEKPLHCNFARQADMLTLETNTNEIRR